MLKINGYIALPKSNCTSFAASMVYVYCTSPFIFLPPSYANNEHRTLTLVPSIYVKTIPYATMLM
jgi:hypothetical protein